MAIVIYVGSFALGLAAGLICAAYFGVVLRSYSQKHSERTQRALEHLITLALGGGLTDYVVFDTLLGTGAFPFYVLGFGIGFVPCAIIMLVEWFRRR